MDNMRNVLRIKDLPSNTIEEAIIILKENKKAKKYEYTEKFKKCDKDGKKDDNYVIKEAELIIADYLKCSEEGDKTINKSNRRLKWISAILGLLLIVSIIF